MSAGLEAVKQEIVRGFGSVEIREHLGMGQQDTTLYFSADNRHYAVRVSAEFDQDYSSGQVGVDLRRLTPFLRASKDGKATLKRKGISD